MGATSTLDLLLLPRVVIGLYENGFKKMTDHAWWRIQGVRRRGQPGHAVAGPARAPGCGGRASRAHGGGSGPSAPFGFLLAFPLSIVVIKP